MNMFSFLFFLAKSATTTTNTTKNCMRRDPVCRWRVRRQYMTNSDNTSIVVNISREIFYSCHFFAFLFHAKCAFNSIEYAAARGWASERVSEWESAVIRQCPLTYIYIYLCSTYCSINSLIWYFERFDECFNVSQAGGNIIVTIFFYFFFCFVLVLFLFLNICIHPIYAGYLSRFLYSKKIDDNDFSRVDPKWWNLRWFVRFFFCVFSFRVSWVAVRVFRRLQSFDEWWRRHKTTKKKNKK